MLAAGGAQALPADRRRGQLPQRGAGAAVRRRPRGASTSGRVATHPVGRLERRPEGRRRLHQALASRQRGLGQRPDLGQPPLDVRRRRPRGAHLPVLRRRRPAACASTRCWTTLRDAAARSSVVLLHACCHNPTGVDLTRAQWDAADPAAARARAAALPGPGLPGLRRRHRRRRLRGARAGRRAGLTLLRRQLVLQEHERVRRALRRAQRGLPRRGARPSWCSAS